MLWGITFVVVLFIFTTTANEPEVHQENMETDDAFWTKGVFTLRIKWYFPVSLLLCVQNITGLKRRSIGITY